MLSHEKKLRKQWNHAKKRNAGGIDEITAKFLKTRQQLNSYTVYAFEQGKVPDQ